jgi:dihydrofolate synthase / folylpolyglutamate synthase
MQQAKEVLIKGIKTHIITAGDDLLEVIKKSLKSYPLKEKDVLMISSKVVAVTQGRIRKIKNGADFKKLVEKEADKVIGGGPVTLTMKNGIFIPWAGIDRSNIKKGYAVLWPQKPFETAAQLQKALRKAFGLKHLGIIISDSHCVPLRKGITGIAIGYAGFRGVRDLRGKKDLFGNRLEVTQQNIADMLSSATHLVMGEASEQTPFVLVRNAPAEFTNGVIDPEETQMREGKCLFDPLY